MMKIAALILAAGKSKRFGACKQLALIHDKPLIQYSLEIAEQVCPGHVYVVSGAWHNEIKASGLVDERMLIYHAGWEKGMGSSIAKGVSKLSARYNGVFILLSDQVGISAKTLKTYIGYFNGSNIVCSFYAGRRGVPALFSSKSYPKLVALKGEKGAKSLLYGESLDVVEIPLEFAEIDIDTQQNLLDYAVKLFSGKHQNS